MSLPRRKSRSVKKPARSLQLEFLESRQMLTAWHNEALPTDVNNSGTVEPQDIIFVINEMQRRTFINARGELPVDRPDAAPFLDVLNNGTVAGNDAIVIVNKLILDNPDPGPDPDPDPDPNPDDNEFFLAEDAPEGTLVGRIKPSTNVTANTIFELVKDADIPADIRNSLQLRPDDHYVGAADAAVVVIEYVDFACPVCGIFHPLNQQALDDFDGEVAYVTRHLPLTQIHPNAGRAAIAAEAAGRQGMFDEMADLLFTRRTQTGWDQQADPTLAFQSFALQLGLNMSQFNQDMADPALENRVLRDRDEAVSVLGLGGTPSFVINDQLAQNPSPTQAGLNNLLQNAINLVDSPFKIDRFTGDIRVRDASLLDFESTRSYSFDVMVNGVVETIDINLTDVPGA